MHSQLRIIRDFGTNRKSSDRKIGRIRVDRKNSGKIGSEQYQRWRMYGET